MSNQNQDLEQIELSIEQAKEKIEMAERLHRLQQNQDFLKLIEGEYLNNYPLRLVSLKAHPEMQKPERKEFLEQRLNAISFLNNYFMTITTEAREAAAAMENDEAERVRMMQEDE